MTRLVRQTSPSALVRTSQPQGAVGIDWSNPITRGLVDVIDMRCATPVSVILGTPTKTFGTRPVVGVTGRGVASDSTAGFGGWYFDRTDGKYAPSGDQTFVYVGSLTSASTQYAGIVVTADGTGANNAVSWQYGNASDIFSFFNTTQVTLTGATASTYDGSDSVFALVVKSGVSATHYKNGIQVVSTGTAASAPSYGTSRLVVFGERAASYLYASKGKSNLVAHFRRSLSHAEIRSISQNPWQIFKPIVRQYPFDLVRGPVETRQSRMLGTSDGAAATVAPAVLLPRSVRTQQPQGSVGIDWSNPITRGLIIAAVPYGATMRDVVSGAVMTTSGSPTTEVNQAGRVFKTVSGSSQYGYFPCSISNNPCTLIVQHTLDSSATGAVISLGTNSGTERFVLFYGSVAGNYTASAFPNSGGSASQVASATGVLQTVGVKFSGGYGTPFAGGNIGTTGTDVFLGSGLCTRLYISARMNSTAGVFSSQRVSVAMAFSRDLSDAEIRSISQNPWQIFLPLNRQIWVAA